MNRVMALVITLMLLPACSSLRLNGPRVTLPAIAGWYDGMRVYYVTTEITDPTMARNAGVTYAPRLEDAVPQYPKPPELRTVLERVYKFPGNEQDAVFASAPTPPGPESSDAAYSPLWLAYFVRRNALSRPHALTSERAIQYATEANEVSVERTSIVINCPIIWTAAGGALPHSRLTP